MASRKRDPAVGIGYRSAMADWTRANLERFDVLEITVDHCIHGGAAQRAESSIWSAVSRSMRTASGSRSAPMCRSIPPISIRLPQIVERLGAPTYSEHLAFTRVPGRDLANLLPLPQHRGGGGDDRCQGAGRPVPHPGSVSAGEHLLRVRVAGFASVRRRISQADLPRDRRRPAARHRESLSQCQQTTASTRARLSTICRPVW